MGDRALFGNMLKPFGVSFEPKTHPLFAEFVRAYDAAQQVAPAGIEGGSPSDALAEPAVR